MPSNVSTVFILACVACVSILRQNRVNKISKWFGYIGIGYLPLSRFIQCGFKASFHSFFSNREAVGIPVSTGFSALKYSDWPTFTHTAANPGRVVHEYIMDDKIWKALKEPTVECVYACACFRARVHHSLMPYQHKDCCQCDPARPTDKAHEDLRQHKIKHACSVVERYIYTHYA